MKAEQIGSWQQTIIFKSSCLSSFSSQTTKGFSVVSFGIVKELFPPLLSPGKGKMLPSICWLIKTWGFIITVLNACVYILYICVKENNGIYVWVWVQLLGLFCSYHIIRGHLICKHASPGQHSPSCHHCTEEKHLILIPGNTLHSRGLQKSNWKVKRPQRLKLFCPHVQFSAVLLRLWVVNHTWGFIAELQITERKVFLFFDFFFFFFLILIFSNGFFKTSSSSLWALIELTAVRGGGFLG